jgi:hypothetical protein
MIDPNLNPVILLSEKMRNYNFMLTYRGNFSQKVFNVMVECLQNICKHSEETKKPYSPALFMIGRIEDVFVIYSSNLIQNEFITDFEYKLKTINSLNTEELKEFYKTLIKQSTISEVGGAGLGLIDIAKKTGSALDYDFFEVSNNHSFFTLRTFINYNPENAPENIESKIMPMHNVFDFHDLMLKHNTVMMYQGDFSQEIVKTVLAMTEKSLNEEQSSGIVKKKVFNVMVEMLQNVCKHQHAVNIDNFKPVFMVGENENFYYIISGNAILKTRIDALINKIEHLNTLNAEELKDLFKTTRLNSQISKEGGAGLGFIDVIRKAENKLEFSFYPINTESSMFVFKTTISKNSNQ